MYFMSDPQALHVTRNVIPGKLGVDLHLHRVHIPLVKLFSVPWEVDVLLSHWYIQVRK